MYYFILAIAVIPVLKPKNGIMSLYTIIITRAERENIKSKIRNIRKDGANKKRGEEHRNRGTRK